MHLLPMLAVCAVGAVITLDVPRGLPADVPRPDPALATLGARLFADRILSEDRHIACASCHQPEHGFADFKPHSSGIGGAESERNAPSLFNRALGTSFMWDGRAATLEAQVLMPIENPKEMGLAVDDAVARLAADASYAAEFERATGAPPSRDALASALAAFVRGLLLGDSAVDRFRAGDYAALTDRERQGLWFFESRGNCWQCHSGPNYTDERFHATGVGAHGEELEPGRFAITGDPADRGAFKTPSLRGVARTPPYMHDGQTATLADVVAYYRRGGHRDAPLDPLIRPLEMTDDDAANLIAFLEALSSRSEPVVPGAGDDR